MNIAIIGAGRLGRALARRLVLAGHAVSLSFSREADWEKDALAAGAYPRGVAEAVGIADAIALAFPWGAADEAIAALGGVASKVVWDCTNALKPDMSGLAVGTTTSGGEILAARLPGSRFVKAIPAFADLLASDRPTIAGEPATSFVCSDDAHAKRVVIQLLADLPVKGIDAGPLENARYAEAACFLAVRLAYGQNLGPRISLSLAVEAGGTGVPAAAPD